MTTVKSEASSWFDDDELVLPPIKSEKHPEGKVYKIKSPSFETGMLLQSMVTIANKVHNGIEVSDADKASLKMDDEDERNFSEVVLGETLAKMRADGVSWGPIRRATQYAFTYFAMSPDKAEELIRPKAPKNRTERRKKPTKKPS